MYQKKYESLHVQNECVTTRKSKTMFQEFMKRWKRRVFKYMFKSIEVLWRVIQVVTTLGKLVYLVMKFLG